VSKAVRDELGELAAANTSPRRDASSPRSAERQRRMGDELAVLEPTDEMRSVISAGLATVNRHARR